MADDVMQVEVEILDAKAGKVLADLKKAFEDAGQEFVKANTKMSDKLLATIEDSRKKALSLQSDLKTLAVYTPRGKALDWISTQAANSQKDIARINKELQNIGKLTGQTNQKSLIKFYQADAKLLTDELEKAEKQLGRLQQAGLNARTGASKTKTGGRSSEFNRTLLELTDDFAPVGLNKPFNAVGKEILGIEAITLTTLATMGAIVAAGYAIVKVTQFIKEEAARHLKYEEQIASAINKQILAQEKSVKTLKESRQLDNLDRDFGSALKNLSPDLLKGRRALYEQLFNLDPTGANAERLAKQIRDIDDRLDQIPKEKNKVADDLFEKRWTDWKKRQETERKITQQTFQNVLSDPDLTAQKLNDSLAKIKSGLTGLLPEETDKLIRDYDKALRSLSQKAISLRDGVKDALVAGREGNQLTKLMLDLDSVTERAEKRFGGLGSSIVKMVADSDRALLKSQIGQFLYQSSAKALDFEQQAGRLANLPANQTGQFDRRLSLVNTKSDFALTNADLTRKAAEAAFYANQYKASDPKDFNKVRLGDKVGQAEIIDSLAVLKTLKSIGDENTGAAGKGAIANRILSILPDRQNLLKELDQGGQRADAAKTLLSAAAEAAEAQKVAAEAAFKDALAMDQIKQNVVRDAEAKLGNLQTNGKGLSERQKVEEFLAITGELGDQNLTSTLKQGRIQALSAMAGFTRQEAADQAKQAKLISDTMTDINSQLKGAGLKVKLNEVPVVNIEIRDNSLSATQGILAGRAGNDDVASLLQ